MTQSARQDTKDASGLKQNLLAAAPKVTSASSSVSVPAVPQSDVYQTLSHLHQRAAFHTALSVLGKGDESSTSAAAAATTATNSVRAAKMLAAKATIRLDVGLKRTSCKGCSTSLLPGLTSQVRVHPSGPHVRVARTECLTCGFARKIPTPPLLGAASASLLRSDVEKRKGKGKRNETKGDISVIMTAPVLATAAHSIETAGEVAIGATQPARAPVTSKPTTQRARRKAARLRARAAAAAQPSNKVYSSFSLNPPRPSRTDRKLKRRLASFVASGTSMTSWSVRSVKETLPLSARLSKAPRGIQVRKSRKASKLSLPPFFERTRGSGWDEALPLPPATLTAPQVHPLEDVDTRVARALRAMRGNHIVAKGLGQGGGQAVIE